MYFIDNNFCGSLANSREAGIGCTVSPGTTKELDTHRMVLIKLLITCFSETLYLPPSGNHMYIIVGYYVAMVKSVYLHNDMSSVLIIVTSFTCHYLAECLPNTTCYTKELGLFCMIRKVLYVYV